MPQPLSIHVPPGAAPFRFAPPAGPVSTLTAEARADVLEHFRRLSDDDLRLRFLRCMPAASLEAHVASLDFDAAIRLGIWRHGRLVALVEGFVYGRPGDTTMEVAFSTDPAWRRRGLACSLGDAIAAVAARRGVSRIVAHCDARNAPMKSLLHAFSAVIDREEGELSATWFASPFARRPEAAALLAA